MVLVGTVVGAFGLQGFLKVEVQTDFPERFDLGAPLWIGGNRRFVEATHVHKSQLRLKLSGIDSVDQAEELRGEGLYFPAEERQALDKDEYYLTDLLGMDVLIDSTGERVGIVDEIIPAPAQDILRVGSALIPMVGEFISSVDLYSSTIRIKPIPGMLDEA